MTLVLGNSSNYIINTHSPAGAQTPCQLSKIPQTDAICIYTICNFYTLLPLFHTDWNTFSLIHGFHAFCTSDHRSQIFCLFSLSFFSTIQALVFCVKEVTVAQMKHSQAWIGKLVGRSQRLSILGQYRTPNCQCGRVVKITG